MGQEKRKKTAARCCGNPKQSKQVKRGECKYGRREGTYKTFEEAEATKKKKLGCLAGAVVRKDHQKKPFANIVSLNVRKRG